MNKPEPLPIDNTGTGKLGSIRVCDDDDEERLSICCTSHPDNRWHYDDDTHEGICDHCKEHSKFLKEGEDE